MSNWMQNPVFEWFEIIRIVIYMFDNSESTINIKLGIINSEVGHFLKLDASIV